MDGDPAEMNVSQSSSSMEVKEDVDTRSDSENQAAGDALVDINFCGSTPMLWKVSDMKKCRSVGVIGALVGSLARQPRQNVRLGRPLELLQEEALLLVETGSAAASLHTQVSLSQLSVSAVENINPTTVQEQYIFVRLVPVL